jgi:hypothetical protein|uniref:Uncharacterized protein n=1 Tax=Myoviridae sp. ctqfO1 TaxID=2827710 RepID=A0A8S5T2I6_9CAUD|nr:MAG TPA: hypothetical protein [Myoviridae sp. ctqfO1]
MKKIEDAIRCAYGVSVVINRVSIKFNREDTADDFMLGDQSFPYWKVSALANAASGIVIDTASLQISVRKEGNSIYYEKVKIRKDGSEYRSVYDADKEQGSYYMERNGVTVRRENLDKDTFINWINECEMNYYGIK